MNENKMIITKEATQEIINKIDEDTNIFIMNENKDLNIVIDDGLKHMIRSYFITKQNGWDING